MSFTVLTAEFSHETNTFNCKPADYAAFAAQGIQLGDDFQALQLVGRRQAVAALHLDSRDPEREQALEPAAG